MSKKDDLISQVIQQAGLSGKVYRDEPILRTAAQMKNYLPERCRQMRRIAFQGGTRSMTSAEIFYKQGKFMEDFEDDCPYSGTFIRYYPTYESMSDNQLRGYFTWRARVRRGEIEKTQLSFVYVYVYELLNGIGASDALDAYRKLSAFYERYREIDAQINRYVQLWLRDYVVYYDLDPALLEQSEEYAFDCSLDVLIHYSQVENDRLFDALCALSSYAVLRSRFYREHADIYRDVLCETYRSLCRYYEKNRKYSLAESFFGRCFSTPYSMFYSAIFYPRTKQPDRTYSISKLSSFTCKDGKWTCSRIWGKRGKNADLGVIARAVDAHLRDTLDYPYSLKADSAPKYLQKIITESVEACRKVKREQAIRKVSIDLSRLDEIRSAAEITRERLIVEEETEDSEEALPLLDEESAPENALQLDEVEASVLRALLHGEDAKSVLQGTGRLLSVVAESINEKCYDTFADTVLVYEGDTLTVLEDYADELKGLLS
ncbi:MAG: TerB N-terminal domain-containing protein [Clostridia bacterium]|nr:TerB N-terminal domain-containing protein [Clostridia bacterium]